MKKVVLIIAVFLSGFSFAQENYNYIILPKKFSIFKEENKYSLNAISKSFFENEGFQVFYDSDEFPEDLAKNRCLALFVDVTENNGIFTTKVNFEFKDCYNKVVLISDQGTSREKDYQKAYIEAFRGALNSVKGSLKIKNATIKSTEKTKEVVESVPSKKSNGIINTSELKAVATDTGYNLVDYSGHTVFYLYSTSLDTVFLAGKEIYKGVLLKKNNGWFFEYDFDGKVYSEKVEVRF